MYVVIMSCHVLSSFYQNTCYDCCMPSCHVEQYHLMAFELMDTKHLIFQLPSQVIYYMECISL